MDLEEDITMYKLIKIVFAITYVAKYMLYTQELSYGDKLFEYTIFISLICVV